MARRVVISARGKKVDFDALKDRYASMNSIKKHSAKPKKIKEKPTTAEVVVPRIPRLTMESPAPRPIPVEEPPVQVTEIDVVGTSKPTKKR